jgi:hypothetical protein
VSAQHPADGAGRDLAAKAEQFAADPLVASPRVLPRESQDQLLYRVGNRWASPRRRPVGPPSAHHAPMPAEQRIGLDQEHRPAGSRELAAQRCQQGAILGLQPGPWMLATQDPEFVTQDQDLDLLGLSRLAAEHDQLKDTAQRQIHLRPDHRPPGEEGEQATAHHTKENESSWIFEPRLTCSDTLWRVQNPGFSLVSPDMERPVKVTVCLVDGIGLGRSDRSRPGA